ncbi:TspO/MBR family protein [Paenibacillus glycanilyticus]|uniref:Tryptophan-rich protein TspO n=1 Tax=Paenibacillus glycanilyticus TaxID=126569 RepID=A0ABQ6GN07_9BACL|nr:TspO/MBR family protein [Paenibacillus glycanilyticus]GLX70788.1 tryptophan-rich protein TspO [Paenibacillus glycanilyticus]
MLAFISVFLITYVLFSLSGILFPTDLAYYADLKKPDWNPPKQLFGIVWGIIYALISLSVAIVYLDTSGFKEASIFYLVILLINYVANQAFVFIEFKLKNPSLAFLDTAIVAVTTALLIYFTVPYSTLAAWLLVPYLLWSCFATVLAHTIFKLNE